MNRGWWDSFLYDDDPDPNADPDKGGGGGGGKPEWAEEFGDKFEPEKAWNLIKNLRSSERTLKGDLKKVSDKVKGFEDKDKTETEKMTAQLEELRGKLTSYETQAKAQVIQTALTEEAKKAGAIYPDDVYRFVTESDLEVGDDGKVKNASKLINELKTSRPALFGKAPSADGANGHNNGSPAGENMNDAIRGAFGRGR